MPLRNLVANSWMIHADGPGLLALSQSLGVAMIAALGVPLLMLMIAAIAGNMVQHRLVWSGESLKPKLSKISPLAGAKRVFGKQAHSVAAPGQAGAGEFALNKIAVSANGHYLAGVAGPATTVYTEDLAAAAHFPEPYFGRLIRAEATDREWIFL